MTLENAYVQWDGLATDAIRRIVMDKGFSMLPIRRFAHVFRHSRDNIAMKTRAKTDPRTPEVVFRSHAIAKVIRILCITG